MYTNQQKKFLLFLTVSFLCLSIFPSPMPAFAEPSPAGEDYFSTGDPDVFRMEEIVEMRDEDMKVYQLSNGQIQ